MKTVSVPLNRHQSVAQRRDQPVEMTRLPKSGQLAQAHLRLVGLLAVHDVMIDLCYGTSRS